MTYASTRYEAPPGMAASTSTSSSRPALNSSNSQSSDPSWGGGHHGASASSHSASSSISSGYHQHHSASDSNTSSSSNASFASASSLASSTSTSVSPTSRLIRGGANTRPTAARAAGPTASSPTGTSSRNGSAPSTSAGPRSAGMQSVVTSSKALREQASTNYHHQQAHRRAQNSEDNDGSPEYGESSNVGLAGAQYAPYYGQYAGPAGGGGLTPSPFAPSSSMSTEDQSFDYMLSPALAPVGPISSIGLHPAGASGQALASGQSASNSGAQLQVHSQPPPSQPIPSLPHSSSSSFLPGAPSARPTFGRSQTAIPSSSSASQPMTGSSSAQARVYNVGHKGTAGAAVAPRTAWGETASDRQQPPSSSISQVAAGARSGHAAQSSGQGSNSHPGRDYTPPPPISASALLEMVLKMRGDASPATGPGAQGGAFMSMARSQSANAAPPGAGGHFAGGRIGLPPSALSGSMSGLSSSVSHNRNISTGSNRSEEDSTSTVKQSYHGGGLQPPPGLARTVSSKNVNENSTTAPGSGLETVVLSHQRVAEVPDEVIEVLAGTVGRLALSYNYIASLPPSFSKLGSTLRYLNIRLNMFTVFPPVLCEIPSLEILDISRNKIKRLPAQCGTLKNLRVFSISKNRVKRLPTYFADMKNLRVLKIDHNPLEWPPREIVTQPIVPSSSGDPGSSAPKKDVMGAVAAGDSASKLDEAQALQKWLVGLQDWIRDHASEAPAMPILQTSNSEDFIFRDGEGRQRDRDRSRSEERQQQSQYSQQTVPPLLLGSLSSSRPGTGTSPAQASPLFELSTSRSKENAEAADPTITDSDGARLSQHARNASHSLAGTTSVNKRGLKVKKSLPDLRQDHAQILDERFGHSVIAEDHDEQYRKLVPDSVPSTPHRHQHASPSSQSPADTNAAGRTRPDIDRQHTKTGSSSSISITINAKPLSSSGLPTPPRSASGDRLKNSQLPMPRVETDNRSSSPSSSQGESNKPPLHSPILEINGSLAAGGDEMPPVRIRRNLDQQFAPNGHNQQLGPERGNSGAYFRRLSMLPAFTISKAVPPTLLEFVDAIRGILFSLSQIHASIKQCVVFPAPDRLPASLSKIMASGDDAMGFLIDTLDRFDSSSRRGSPDVAVVKEVIETCRENVAIFGKLVQNIVSHISLLFGPAMDIRYSRTFILSVYGAMGEIATSWDALTPLKDEIIAWMKGDPADLSPNGLRQTQDPKSSPQEDEQAGYGGSLSKTSSTTSAINGVHSAYARSPLASPALPTSTVPTPKQRPQQMPSVVSAAGNQATAIGSGGRRHAGSFTNYNPR